MENPQIRKIKTESMTAINITQQLYFNSDPLAILLAAIPIRCIILCYHQLISDVYQLFNVINAQI